MKKVIIFTAFLISLSGVVFACQCAQRPLRANYISATIVFEGTVVKSDLNMPAYSATHFIQIEDKALVASSTGRKLDEFKKKDNMIVITSGAGGGDCGFIFELNEKYLIFAKATSEGELFTDICSGTVSMREGEGVAEEVRKYKESK